MLLGACVYVTSGPHPWVEKNRKLQDARKKHRPTKSYGSEIFQHCSPSSRVSIICTRIDAFGCMISLVFCPLSTVCEMEF